MTIFEFTKAPPEWLKVAPYRLENTLEPDDNPDNIYLAVGKVTHAWETLEGSLGILYTFLSECPSAAALLSYGSQTSSSGRGQMIRAASNGYSWKNKRPEVEKAVKKLLEYAQRIVASRNIAAHGQVFTKTGNSIVTHVANSSAPSASEFVLCPASYNTSKQGNRLQAKVWFSSAEIIKIEAAIYWLNYEVQFYLSHSLLGDPSPALPLRACMFLSNS